MINSAHAHFVFSSLHEIGRFFSLSFCCLLVMSRNEPGRVYVGDLGSGGSKPELEREFERYGPLKSVWVARNPPGKSRANLLHLFLYSFQGPPFPSSGFAFIEFEDPRDAEDAVRDMDGRFVCGVRIRVEIAKSNSRY